MYDAGFYDPTEEDDEGFYDFMHEMLSMMDNVRGERFFDDSVRNVVAASSLGLHCGLVGKSERPEGIEYALESTHNMKEAIPELREGDEKSESIIHPQEIAIETSVVA
ncbi:hypothetical protein Droror1_Dr00006414 [Drosera rotundifolia]